MKRFAIIVAVGLAGCGDKTDNSTTIISCNFDSEIVVTQTVPAEQIESIPTDFIVTEQQTVPITGELVYTVEFCQDIGNRSDDDVVTTNTTSTDGGLL